MRVAIVGAGVSGLGAALVLARAGHDVVVLERDATPLPDSPDEAFDWNRRGAPQVRHSHAFLARLRVLLRDRLPDVREDLIAAGATEVAWWDMRSDTLVDPQPDPGDDDLVMLCCRRTTFEWVLRRAALRTDRVELRDGTAVTGLACHDGSRPPRVTGVATSSGPIEADIVLDATGRPSQLPAMLEAVGARICEERSPSGIVYLSRFYRLLDGATEPDPQPLNGGDLEYLKYAIFRGDNRSFSITLAYNTDDEAMRSLRSQARFEAALRLVPAIEPWVDPGTAEPISDVAYMGGLINRTRSVVIDGAPEVLGLHVVGDAAVCTNPLYGRGCALGMVHGALFADALAESDDPTELAVAFDELTRTELVPWYRAAVMQDEANMALARGEPLTGPNAYARQILADGLLPAARIDQTIARAWFRTFNLLATPDALMNDPYVMQRALEEYQRRHEREPPQPLGPTRDGFLTALHA